MLSKVVDLLLPWLWTGAVLALILATSAAVLRSAWAKGQQGEQRVRRMLRRHLDTCMYVTLNNVTLKILDGSSTQIDHVVVSCFGIFAIETKNMKGRIQGSEHVLQWVQKLHHGRFFFQNPLRQNHCHTLALQEVLQVPAASVHSVIAFVGQSQLDGNFPDNVTQGKECVQFIRSFTQVLWSHSQVQHLIEQLQQKRLAPTQATHRTHVRRLRKRNRNRPDCAACGSSMVLRTAQIGAWAGMQFWGCSCYPKCKMVQPV